MVTNYDYGQVYRWHKDKFKNRLILMQDLVEIGGGDREVDGKYNTR